MIYIYYIYIWYPVFGRIQTGTNSWADVARPEVSTEIGCCLRLVPLERICFVFFFRSFSCVSWEFWADPKYASLYVNLWQVGVKKIPLPGRKDWLSKLVLATSVILTLWSRTELNKTLMTWVWVKIKELGDYNLHLQWIFPLKSPFLVDFPSKT